MRHQAWSIESGLPHDSVHQITQSDDGFIWIATEAGVARFDGTTFTSFNRSNDPAFRSDDACCLAKGKDGDLWVGTTDGLIRWSHSHWLRFDEKDGLPSSSIRAMLSQADGSLLILTANGVVEWRQGRFTRVENMPPNIAYLASAGRAGSWLLGDNSPMLRNKNQLLPFKMKLGEISRPNGISQGPDETLWTFSNNVVVAIGRRGQRTWRLGSELPGSRVESLFVDRGGAAWVGTNDGLVILTADVARATKVDFLKGNIVLQTFEDCEGNHWIGTETSGLHLIKQTQFRNEQKFADKSLNSVLQTPSGTQWVGTRLDGLRRMHGQRVDEPVKTSKLTSPVILSLATSSDGSVWAGTPDGLNRIRPNGSVLQITSVSGLPDDYIQSLVANPDGSVWAGTRHGLVHILGKGLKILTAADGLSGDLVGALLLSKENTLWVGTSGGVSSITGTGKIVSFTRREGLSPGNVTALAESSTGTIWVATSGGGLNLIAHRTVRPLVIVGFKKRVFAIASDGFGYLWLRTEEGFERVPSQELERCGEGRDSCNPHITHYGVADGVPSVDVSAVGSPSMWKMANGEMWMATRRGMAITDPSRLLESTSPPPVVIERFLVDESQVSMDTGGIRVGPSHVRYTIEYVALNYTSPSAVRYRFRLDGLDKEWTNAGGRRFATYTNLPGGNYRFRVQAANRDGVWNEAAPGLVFRVIPPFYKRWWFASLITVLVLVVAVGLYKLRLQRLELRYRAVLQERSRLAREIHDTLAQDFVGMSIQLDLVAQLLSVQKVEAALEQVRRARRAVTDGLAEARQSIWELRTNLPQDGLPIRLRQIVKRYSSDSLTVRLKIGGAFRRLDSLLEGEVLRIAQEALSNMRRHAEATDASVELSYGSDALMLVVQDDGKGFDVAEGYSMEGHYGLRGMEERASVLRGRVEVVSDPGNGTRVTLSVPIASAKE